MRPIAVGQALRRLVTKVHLAPVTEDTRDRLLPEQIANAVSSGMDAIVHDCRMIKHRLANSNYVMVSVDANNAINNFSRQSLLDRLPLQGPTLAPFLNLMYGRTVPDPVLASTPRFLMGRQEGTQ